MERQIIFKNTETGEELVMPVTPPSYQIEHGRKQNTETLYMVGDVTAPGPAVLLDEEPEFLLPAHDYPFNQPGAILNPFVYLEKLEKWSDAGTVLRYVVADTPINAAVRFGPIRFREQDGTNDIYCTVPIRGVRQLEAEELEVAESPVPLGARAAEADPVKAGSYTVVQGDTLGGICRRFYGNANLAAALAAYNGVKNVNLIHPGQVLNIPDRSALPASGVAQSGKVTPKAESSPTVAVTVSFGAGTQYYYGKAKVGYTHESGASGMQLLSKTTPSVTVKAKRGTKVAVVRTPDSAYPVSYFTVDGANKAGGSGEISVTADKDRKIGVYWGRG